MVEENGPDYADADAMRDARRALGVGLHEVIELGAQGYRFATPDDGYEQRSQGTAVERGQSHAVARALQEVNPETAPRRST